MLAAAAFKSRDEILRLISERSRPMVATSAQPAAEPRVEALSGSLAPGQVNSLADLCRTPDGGAAPVPPSPSHVNSARRGRVSVSATGGHEVRLSITEAEHEDLRRAQTLLGHAVPSGDLALIYARAMKHYLAFLEKQRFGVKRCAVGAAGSATSENVPATSDAAPGSHAPEQVDHVRCGRGIPKALRGLVWERDSGRCAFVSADGHRCDSTQRLELDHVTPLAKGGRSTPENLRVLCRAHNQYEAERVLGKDHIQTKRELAQRERARAKVAAKADAARAKVKGAVEAIVVRASAARPKARDAARQVRYNDIHGALVGLGFKVAQAKFGAELADEMPDASLEACVRHALTVLTRPLAMRGERMARSTA